MNSSFDETQLSLSLLAMFAEEDRQVRIKQLQEKASIAFINLEIAQSLEDQVRFQNELKDINAAISREEKRSVASAGVSSSQAKIQSQLVQQAPLEEKKRNHPASASPDQGIKQLQGVPLRIFNPEEIKAIDIHYASLPPHLKGLVDAVLEDNEIMFNKIRTPVFLRNEGEIYNLEVAQQLVGMSFPKRSRPDNVTSRDIIPCRTIAEAMDLLLEIIELKNHGKEKDTPVIPILRFEKDIELPKEKQRIPLHMMQVIDKIYDSLNNNHKWLFNKICRDPITNKIIQCPVLLPDGCVYDLTTAQHYLKEEKGVCPRDKTITFTQNDITPCYFIDRVITHLNESMEKFMTASQHPERPALLPPAGPSFQLK